MKLTSLIAVVVLLTLSLPLCASPVLQVIHPNQQSQLLRNGGFEQLENGQPVAWQPAPQGFGLAPDQGRNGSHALFCDNSSGEGWFGASQTLALNRTNPAPLTVRAWSKAVHVSGAADSDYSLYVDLTYADGTPLWGQSVSFHTGTHDWDQRQLAISPQKPVKTLTLHCLFRHHAGQVYFDDVRVEESQPDADVLLFQGAAVKRVDAVPASILSTRTLATGDGLSLSFHEHALSALQVNQRPLPRNQDGGFLVRDVAANSDFFPFTGESCAELGLKLQVQTFTQSNHITFQGRLADVTGRDRAISLAFAVPLEAQGWSWGDDIRRHRTIRGQGEFANHVAIGCGAIGTQSLYPVAAVWDDQTGVALALDLGQPAVYRVGYQAGLQSLFIAYDLGLVQDTTRFPSSAEFRFVLYQFDPAAGFRAAWAKYMAVFPEYFAVRSKEQGLWMPFTDVARVQGWQDFGFRYHEGHNNVRWDDQHGILSFRYTEPMTWWMPMAKDIPRTLPEAIRVRDDLAQQGTPAQRNMAEVTQRAGMADELGEPELLFRNTPWANGAVWSLNPNPWLGTAPPFSPAHTTSSATAAPTTNLATAAPLNAATVHWNERIKDRFYGPEAKGQLDGEYLDSLEGYVTAELNFRREHFRWTTVPLTFSTETQQPALHKGLAVFEFTRWMGDDVHSLGKLMFANGVPYRFGYLCPWLDVLGTETDWLQAGRYHPAPLATMDLWRSFSGAKPYLLLMNTDYDQFTPDLVEKYFQRALFYGMWPGFFSHNAADNPYWQNPAWYNRDRPLFRQYIPLLKRVAEAGWHPLPYATSDNPDLLFERFGPAADGTVYLTLFNDTSQPQQAAIRIQGQSLALSPAVQPRSLLGPAPTPSGPAWATLLQPQQVALWELSR